MPEPVGESPVQNRAIVWQGDIEAARHAGIPIVALESSVFAQGLPPPHNREAHRLMCAAVREAGAMPAVTAVVGGRASVGISDATLKRFLTTGAPKVSARDLGWAIGARSDGATTVAAAIAIAAQAGIEVFATGGIGGVHRGQAFDESADLLELARQPVITVCAGAKSILDLPATVERLETFGVSVIGYRVDEFPGFFTARTGIRLTTVADSPAQIARAFLAGRAMGRSAGVLVVQPPPADAALDAHTVDRAVVAAIREADAAGVRGAAVTPFLLAAVDRATNGASVRTNLALLDANARLAGEIAVALAAEPARD